LLNTTQLVLHITPSHTLVANANQHVDQNGDLVANKKQSLIDYISDIFGLIAGDMGSSQTYTHINQAAQKIVDLEVMLIKTLMSHGYFLREKVNYDIGQMTTLENLKSILTVVSFLGA
jgi:rRNA processing protein Gar1